MWRMWTPVFTVLPILLSTRITVEQNLQIPALNDRPPNLHSQACRIKWPLVAVAVDFTGHHFLLQYPQKQFIPRSLLLFPSLAFVITKHFVFPSVDVSFFHSFIHSSTDVFILHAWSSSHWTRYREKETLINTT